MFGFIAGLILRGLGASSLLQSLMERSTSFFCRSAGVLLGTAVLGKVSLWVCAHLFCG